jgi:hypothetical protein
MQEFKCNLCHNPFMVEKLYHPNPSPTKVVNCPFCGSNDIVCENFQVDRYWYDLAAYYGFGRSAQGADIIQTLYKEWKPNEFSKFAAFLASIEAEIAPLKVQVS